MEDLNTLAIVSTLAALLAQFAAIVWAASKLSSDLQGLRRSVDSLARTAEHLDKRVDEHEVKIRLNEQRIVDLSRVVKI